MGNKIIIILIVAAMAVSPALYAQKGKNKGGGGGNNKLNVNVKTNDNHVKVKTNTKNGNVKIDIKDKGGKGNSGNNGNDGNLKFKNGHDNGNHYGQYKNKTVWFFGPGDIYMVSGKPRGQKIIIFDQVCLRLTANIGFMFGLLGDIRIKLDAKKATWKPERYNKLKVEIDLLETDLKLIEIKKKKIKMRLAKLKNDEGKD
jgi:hypothetical protein